MVKYCLFDAYGTIVELDDFFGRLQRGYARHGVEIPLDDIDYAGRSEMRYYVENTLQGKDEASLAKLRLSCAGVLKRVLEERGHNPDLPPETVGEILVNAEVLRPFPETIEVFQAIREHGIPIGVMTNWDYQITSVMESISLAPYCDFILSSAAVGYRKPWPEFFAAGLNLARNTDRSLQAADCLYIGDTYDNDILGSQKAGMVPLWVVRDDAKRAALAWDDRIPESLPKLADLREVLTYL